MSSSQPQSTPTPPTKTGWNYEAVQSYAKIDYRDGVWGPLEIHDSPYFQMHIGAGVLHYGQSCFEGSKVCRGADNKLRLFRVEENAKRMQKTCERALMPLLPVERFVEAVRAIVKHNYDKCPSHQSGDFFYLRPFLFASGATLALAPSSEFTFMVTVIGVPDYYSRPHDTSDHKTETAASGTVKGLIVHVTSDFDRVAPLGTGRAKLAGNYAPTLLPESIAKKNGAQVVLYLDPLTHTNIEEFSTSNFIAISSQGSYVTPNSPSVLWSITNDSLQTIARDQGLNVELRTIPFAEVPTLLEAGACGTAVSVAPIQVFLKDGQEYRTQQKEDGFGPILSNIREKLRSIQRGDAPDPYNWIEVVERE